MAKKKKIKSGISIALFFIITFIMGTIVGIIIDSQLLKQHNTISNVNNNQTTKSELIDDELKNNLFEIVNNDRLEKVIYNYRNNGTLFENITNDEKLYLANIDSYYKSSGTWVTFDTLKSNLIKEYGTDYNVKNEDYNFHDVATIKNNEGNYEYNGNDFKFTDTRMGIDLYKTIKLEKLEDTYYLSVEGIYHQILNNKDNYTNDKGFVFNEPRSGKTTIDSLYKTNPEQFMKYTFIFILKDNKYILNKFYKI